MTMLGRLALLFVLVPLVELAFLIQVGRWVGIWPTVGLVFLTGVLGALLARAEGLRTLWAFRSQLAAGELPGRALLDGLCILVGGALLLTPGFVTDIAGFSLLLPPTRHLIQKGIERRLRRGIEDGSIRVMTGSDLFGGPGSGPGPFGPRGPGGGGPDSAKGGRDGPSTAAGSGPSAAGGDASGRGRREGSDDPLEQRDLDPEKEISQ